MLARKQRIPRALFDAVRKRARRSSSATLSLSFVPSSESRLAVVVGKKVAGSAVVRNTIRRRVYGAFTELSKDTATRGHFIVTALPKAKGAPYDELKNDLGTLLSASSRVR